MTRSKDTPDTTNPPTPVDPERIWMGPQEARGRTLPRVGARVEYVRADIAAAELAQVQEELAEAREHLRRQSELVEEFVCDDGRSRIASLERELAEARERGDRWKLNSGQQGAKVARLLTEMAWLARNGHAERAQRAVKSADEAAMRVRLEDFVVAQPCSIASHSVEEDPDG